MTDAAAMVITLGIFAFAGFKGLAVALFMLLLFEYMHRRVYGKSISQI